MIQFTIMGRFRQPGIVALLVFASVVFASPAYGWKEMSATWPGDPMDCIFCHQSGLPFPDRTGPHGGYTPSTQKCERCHTVHAAPAGSLKLLPGPTITATCGYCHDGTGGLGVYGAIAARGAVVGADHSIDSTKTVPGGDAGTGGSMVRDFRGEGDNLGCGDCHSPHAANTVAEFSGERLRFHATDRGWLPVWSTTKLLKKRPTGAITDVAEYGSDWCAACHGGRPSGGVVKNHPVDSLLTTTTPFVYDRVAIVTANNALTTTIDTMGLLGFVPGSNQGTWHNRGYVMPYPRTAEQGDHKPICQQCHEDSRIVGQPGAVVHAEIYRFGDGRTSGDAGTDNPLFQSFPHETTNAKMLVESGDDLCMNCHPADSLP